MRVILFTHTIVTKMSSQRPSLMSRWLLAIMIPASTVVMFVDIQKIKTADPSLLFRTALKVFIVTMLLSNLVVMVLKRLLI